MPDGRERRSKPAILIVEDDPAVGDTLGRVVQRLPPAAHVRVTLDGSQALDMLTAPCGPPAELILER